jgi:hypothetical protein
MSAMDRLMRSLDFNRTHGARSTSDAPVARGAKEWVHMTVHHPEITLAINAGRFEVDARSWDVTTLLAFGEQDRAAMRATPAAAPAMRPGGPTVEMPGLTSRIDSGAYRLDIDEPAAGVAARLVLEPVAPPSLLGRRRLAGGDELHWVVVPHLRATGAIVYQNRLLECDRVPAYRDRNWGRFVFGRDTSWDWGYVLPDAADGWAIVFGRLLDRSGNTLDQSMLVWKDRRIAAIHRASEITFEFQGTSTLAPSITVPAALALCRPGKITDIPARAIVTARSARGTIRLQLTPTRIARIVTPGDDGAGTSVIHEALSRVDVEGSFEGEALDFSGTGFLERARG